MLSLFICRKYDNIDEKTITKEQIETYKSIDKKIIENISNILISYGSRLEKYLLEKNSKKIINIDTSLTYFSSIKKYEDYDSNFFINKDWCWMSHIFDQSLLHLFDNVKLVKIFVFFYLKIQYSRLRGSPVLQYNEDLCLHKLGIC
jgi:hypothetical protein